MSTNDTQALVALIEAYADARHKHGAPEYNAVSATARKAVLDALASRQDQQGQAVAWEATTPVYKQFVTQAWYDKARPAVKRWYKPYRCSACAAPSLPVGKEPTP